MKGKSYKRRQVFLAITATLVFAISITAQTTEFTYQGSLADAGTPPTALYDFEFRLFDVLTNGVQLGLTQQKLGVQVSNGAFTVQVDFGAQFTGGLRFLEIAVKGVPGPFTTLAPRQQIRSTPYSIQAKNAAISDTATNALQLGGVAANQYLQTTGNGSGLTNLNAGNVATGTLSNARLGQIPTANIADNAITAPKIAGPQVVKSLNTLKDDVTLTAGSNISITPAGSTLTIASTGVSGSGTTNSIPFWSAGTTLGISQISQSVNGVQMPNAVQLAAGVQGNAMSFGSPNGETGITMAGATSRSDIRFGGTTLKLFAGPAGGPPSLGLAISTSGNVMQARDKGGVVKATIYVESNGAIIRCYNGIIESSTGNCGFSITHPSTGNYTIGFGFQVNDRFVSVTPTGSTRNFGANFVFNGASAVNVGTFLTHLDFNGPQVDSQFMIIIF